MVKIKTQPGPYGVANLSELTIDAAKDWQGYEIQLIGTPTAITSAARLEDAKIESLLGGLI